MAPQPRKGLLLVLPLVMVASTSQAFPGGKTLHNLKSGMSQRANNLKNQITGGISRKAHGLKNQITGTISRKAHQLKNGITSRIKNTLLWPFRKAKQKLGWGSKNPQGQEMPPEMQQLIQQMR